MFLAGGHKAFQLLHIDFLLQITVEECRFHIQLNQLQIVGLPASVKKIPGEYLSEGCDSLSDLRGMTGLVAHDVDAGWSEAEPFGCAESVDSVQEVSVTHETDLVLGARPS